jgi:hypothetical protein
MKTAVNPPILLSAPLAGAVLAREGRQTLVTRFGDAVDVRNRGTLRAARSAAEPAVVRLWNDDQCREMGSHEARALAAQLIAAANLADAQNGH